MTNQRNNDLAYLFSSRAVARRLARRHAKRRARSKIEHRQFYGQDGQLPTRCDILIWSVVFIGIFVFLGMTRTSDNLRQTNINNHPSIINQL